MSKEKTQVRMYNDGWIEWMREGSNDWSCVQVTELIRSYEEKNENAEVAYQKGYSEGWSSGYCARDDEDFSGEK